MSVLQLDLFALAHIGSFLSFTDRSQLNRVCKKWRESLQLWRMDIENYYARYVKVLQRTVRRCVLYNGYYGLVDGVVRDKLKRLSHYVAWCNFINGPRPSGVVLPQRGDQTVCMPPWVVGKSMHVSNRIRLSAETAYWHAGVVEVLFRPPGNFLRRIEVQTDGNRIEIESIRCCYMDFTTSYLQLYSVQVVSVSSRPTVVFLPKVASFQCSIFLHVKTSIENVSVLLNSIRITAHSMFIPQTWLNQ